MFGVGATEAMPGGYGRCSTMDPYSFPVALIDNLEISHEQFSVPPVEVALGKLAAVSLLGPFFSISASSPSRYTFQALMLWQGKRGRPSY